MSRPIYPFLTTDLPGVGGVLKRDPHDFTVDEIPAYEPSGDGEHLFLWIEKRDASTQAVVRRLAEELGCSQTAIGTAGQKDRRGVARQYFSVPAHCEDRIARIDVAGVSLLRSARHGNKLRAGHLHGNRFSILLRDVIEDALPAAERIAERIRTNGFPNYYGEQRFGTAGDNASLGFDLLAGRRTERDLPRARRRFLLRMALSAAQSEMFNRVLAERLDDGMFLQVCEGDVMQVVESGGLFVVEDAEAEQVRFDAGETAVTGPMFGPKMKSPASDVAERERSVLEQFETAADGFTRFPKLTRGARRPFGIQPQALTVHAEQDGLRFEFTLPSGSYATTLLREFQKHADGRAPG